MGVEDLKQNTEYHNYTPLSDQVQWSAPQTFRPLGPPYTSCIFSSSVESALKVLEGLERVYTGPASPCVAAVHVCMLDMVMLCTCKEQRAWFLQFATGTSRVPVEGFKAMGHCGMAPHGTEDVSAGSWKIFLCQGLVGMRGPQKFSLHRAYGMHPSIRGWGPPGN